MVEAKIYIIPYNDHGPAHTTNQTCSNHFEFTSVALHFTSQIFKRFFYIKKYLKILWREIVAS